MRSTIAILVFCFSLTSYAQTFVGTFVFAKGDVKLLKDPAEKSDKKQLIFEGKKYNFETVRIGHKVMPGEIIQTGTNGKAKVVYPNGDHFNIGPGTSLAMPKPEGASAQDASSIDLFYGRLRSLISKDGPRSKMKVKTPATTAGVRGTDFFVRHNLTEGSSITVLRGAVAVGDPKKKPVVVKKAERAIVEKDASVEVALAEKAELLNIQIETAIPQDQQQVAKLSKEVQSEVKELEKNAKQAVLNDIKSEDPALYTKLSKQDYTASDINTEVVAALFKQAPGKIQTKPSAKELEGQTEDDIYKKYFKPGK